MGPRNAPRLGPCVEGGKRKKKREGRPSRMVGKIKNKKHEGEVVLPFLGEGGKKRAVSANRRGKGGGGGEGGKKKFLI